jgi:arylsulfatase
MFRRITRSARLGIAALACCLGCGAQDRSRLDLVIFVLDAARADHFGSYGYPRDTTPHIDAFAAEATRYTSAISESAFTFASMAALFTGAPPHETGLLAPRPIAAEVELLGEVARAAGYRTWGHSENPFISAPYGFARGFDSFASELGKPGALTTPDPRRGVEAALSWLDGEADEPRFVYLHLLRPHNPYAPSPTHAGRFGSIDSADGTTRSLLALDRDRVRAEPGRLANIVALYDENLASADAAFGVLIAGLRDRERLDRTVIVVVADHGEAFGEHGRWLHSTTTHEEMIRIPLLVGVPGASPARVDAPVQLADLGTALRGFLAGIPGSREALTGLGRDPEEATLSWTMRATGRVALRNAQRKLVVDSESLEPVALFDLALDPQERTPLPIDEDGERLLRVLKTRLAGGPLADGVGAAAGPELPLRHQLEALGYVEP